MWIQLTAPPLIKETFWESLCSGLAASGLPTRLESAGFARGRVLVSGVSYLVRADGAEA